MRLRAVSPALVACALLFLIAGEARAAALEIAEPTAIDLWEAGLVVPDNPDIDGPEDLLAQMERPASAALGRPEDELGAVWVALRIDNATELRDWVLVLRQAFIGRIDLWTFNDGRLVGHRAAGVGVAAASAQPRFALGYQLPVVLPPNGERALVLRVEPIFFLGVSPLLQTPEDARIDNAKRRMAFPLLLGAYLGIAALHLILFLRFGGISNILFAGVVVTVFADWFLWLGGLHDLGLHLSVERSIDLSTLVWFSATFFIITFVIQFCTSDRPSFKWHAAGQVAFWGFVLAHVLSTSPLSKLLFINVYLVVSAALIYTVGVLAIRRGRSEIRLALIAYTIGVSSELSAYLGVLLPWLADVMDWMRSTLGLFDVPTLLSQVLVNGLFSIALWERVRSRVRQREAEARAERAKSVRLAQLCHDIRSPLHAVQSLLGAVMAQTPAPVADSPHIAAVQSSVRSIVGALDDMVDLARTGRTRRRDGPVDLRELAADAAAVARAELAGKPVDVRLEVADSVPARVAGDAVAVGRILGNLLSNAVQATDRGRIVITVSRPAASRVRVEVADSGIGIGAQRLAELFGSQPCRVPVDGFGLAVVRRLLEANGGSLGAESRPGEGTTVWFEIAAPEVAEPAAAGTPPADPQVHGLRLLLVEDDELTGEATMALLAADGHVVRRARSVAEAVDLASRLPFDLVMTDLDLAGRSGLEAVRAIRRLADPVRAAVPIVASTGDRQRAEAARREHPGIRAILVKPYDLGELRRAIAAVCGMRPPAIEPKTGAGSGGFLDDLAAVLPAEGLRAVLTTGRSEIAANLAALEKAAGKGRLRAARQSAHRLAGSAATLGFDGLTTAARAAEAAAAGRDRAGLDNALLDVRDAAAAAGAALDSRLGAFADPVAGSREAAA